MKPIQPPGADSRDPSNQEIDPLAFALANVQTDLVWIDEHLASFRVDRISDPASAETELEYAEQCVTDARNSLQRALELVISGYTIDPSKRFPRGFKIPEPQL